jgi:hypothetical protein
MTNNKSVDTAPHECRLLPLGEQLLSALGALLFGYIVGELLLDRFTDPTQWASGTIVTALIYAALLFGYRINRLRSRVQAATRPGR